MGLKALVTPFPWAEYSKKLISKIAQPRGLGRFSKKESDQRGVFLAVGSEGNLEDGNIIQFYWLVDKEDGTIVDVKYQVFGQSALIGAAEVASELLIGKNYDQAVRIGADLIDQQVRDRPNSPAFPMETAPHLNLILGAIDAAAATCHHLPLPKAYEAPPVPNVLLEGEEGGYPGWDTLDQRGKLAILEEIMDRDIRPYIALDGGGVDVLNLLDNEVIIAYQGACTSCFSAVGATLSYIQQVIQTKVHPDLTVTPNFG